MAAVSSHSTPYGSPEMSATQFKGLKKVLSNRRRSLGSASDANIHNLRTDSIDSTRLDKSPTRQSLNSSSPDRDGSIKSGSSGVRKLLPGHAKRERKRVREEELKVAGDEADRGRHLDATRVNASRPEIIRQISDKSQDGSAGFLTDDEEVDRTSPPRLVTRDSHAGYLTTSSPVIRSTTVTERGDVDTTKEPFPRADLADIPILITSENHDPGISPHSHAAHIEPIPVLSPTASDDRLDALKPSSRRSSLSKRGKSPARRFKDVFLPKSKSPRTSPDRKRDSQRDSTTSLSRESTLISTEMHNKKANGTEHTPIQDMKRDVAHPNALPLLETSIRPSTPTKSLMNTPMTTVTPPTPTMDEHRFDTATGSPKKDKDRDSDLLTDEGSKISSAPNANTILHRRVRSAGGNGQPMHLPSKLSSSMTAPLTPADENKTPSGSTVGSRNVSGSFFSSWVSAAQNAATSISNLTGPARNRSGTTTSDPLLPTSISETIKEDPETAEPESPRKQLAVETLGKGDLNLGHLGIDQEGLGDSPNRPSLTELRNNSVIQRDVAAAKEEDMLAKRAVSAAYERLNEATPVAELPDPMNSIKHASTFNSALSSDQATPTGSIFEGEASSIKRSNSVRSKIANRRSRGSSTATGQSATGTVIGASTSTLANPATGPKLTGFAIAPKQRNRNFHQQFRSVPEDDYLIEDYSCALQREIILAGRIYISEGHICFSSNILGWVTTLVISFEEVVSIEKENTALVIPNAIAIQTLHARHTFRSLLSREATYDLLIGIWKVSHPASFQKSINGKQLAAEEATKQATGVALPVDGSNEDSSQSSDDEDDSDDDDESAPSIIGSNGSVTGSDPIEVQPMSRKPSGLNGTAISQLANTPAIGSTEAAPAATAVPAPVAGLPDVVDYPGPTSHAPSECTDSATHYEVVIKDEVLPAPLGKIYSLLYGPQSGVFLRRFMCDELKCLDLVFEDDKKGLSNEIKSRQYSYIKPLGGSIGPKQTKCITTETMDFFDLEKAVTITCSTQTPDVPSGGSFLTKTRYCLTWAPNNGTRLQMNCTVEWSAKSWLKGPIEKGARDGQQQYGDNLVKVLRTTIGRPRGVTTTSKVSKTKKKRKGERREKSDTSEAEVKKEENWGLFEPLRGPLGPVADIARPVFKTNVLLTVLFALVFILWFSKPKTGSMTPYSGWKQADRFAAYEEMWNREESELWTWLEDRTGLDSIHLREQSGKASQNRQDNAKRQSQQRSKALKSKDFETRLREEKMSEKEMEEAIKITRERLEVLEGVVKKRQSEKRNSS